MEAGTKKSWPSATRNLLWSFTRLTGEAPAHTKSKHVLAHMALNTLAALRFPGPLSEQVSAREPYNF